jgi:RimJ/RimL family protein N-acetyltransferase
MRVVPFEAEDLAELLEGGGATFSGARQLMREPGYAETLKAAGPAWSAFDVYGRLIGCGGLSMEHPACATAWTLLDPEVSGRWMLHLTRAVLRVIAECPARRIQAHADPKFAPAARWLQLLGFQQEGILRCFTPDGRDMAVFSRVRS